MGMKNGKYDFQQSHSVLTDGSIMGKRSHESEASIPKCLHRSLLNDSLSNINSQNETTTLVWLDTYIHERASNIDTEVKLKNLFHYIRIFDRVDTCEKYIKHIGKMNNNYHRKDILLVILSTTLAPTLIPHLHSLSQVKFIYVYGKSKTISRAHQNWLQKYEKVKGVFHSSRSLIAQITDDQN